LKAKNSINVRFHLIIFTKGIYHSKDPKIGLLKIAKKEKVQRGKKPTEKNTSFVPLVALSAKNRQHHNG